MKVMHNVDLCDQCSDMYHQIHPSQHKELVPFGKGSRLRSLGRPVITVRHFECKHCKAHWIQEVDDGNGMSMDWICLHGRVSILTPEVGAESATRPRSAASRTDRVLRRGPEILAALLRR